jgi:hypothetical protein
MCFTDMPDVCKAIIPYTSYPNEPLQLFDEEAYVKISTEVWAAAHSCNNTDAIIWGACNAIYPRCLLGFSLYLCRQTCLGKPPSFNDACEARPNLRARARACARARAFAPVSVIRAHLYVDVLLTSVAMMFLDGVNASCSGDAKATLSEMCMSLPEERCLAEAPDPYEQQCQEDEFSCGDGECVHGLKLCDRKYDCLRGVDELAW